MACLFGQDLTGPACAQLPRVVRPSGNFSCPDRPCSMRCRTSSSWSGSAANRIRTRNSPSSSATLTWCGASGHGGSWSLYPHSATVTAALRACMSACGWASAAAAANLRLRKAATAILNMSGFLLRLWSDERPRPRAANTRPGPPWLTGDAHQGHLRPA